jgi:uncharacterized membrane protein
VREALLWVLFFVTTVYGHVAMKLAVDRHRSLLSSALSGWGSSAVLAWSASSLLWMMTLQKSSLFRANTIASLRYVLVLVAACALVRKAPTATSALGALLVTVGVALVRE